MNDQQMNQSIAINQTNTSSQHHISQANQRRTAADTRLSIDSHCKSVSTDQFNRSSITAADTRLSIDGHCKSVSTDQFNRSSITEARKTVHVLVFTFLL